MTKADLSIIIVSYNVCQLLDECLASVFATQGDLKLEVILVDNASADDTVSLVQHKYPQVRVIRNTENHGFARATNQGLAIAEGNYLMLLNPDTVVSPLALYKLMDFLARTPDAAAAGPRLLNSDGSLQISCLGFPNLVNTTIFSFASYYWLPRQSHPLRWLKESWDHASLMAVDYVIGAALMIRRSTLEQVGSFDEDFFLYGEEKDWSYRVHKAGYKIYYLPESTVIHRGGQSSKQVSRFALLQLYSSHERFLRKYYGVGHRTLLIGILRLGLVTKAVQLQVQGLLFADRSKRKMSIDYLATLRALGAHRLQVT